MDHTIPFFKFLEKRVGREMPFRVKVAMVDYPYTEEELTIPKGINFAYRQGEIYLPENLIIDGSLSLERSGITYLPKNLTIRGYLDISDTKIEDIPNNLNIDGNLYIRYTKLGRNYAPEDIKHMIIDRGGNIRGKVTM